MKIDFNKKMEEMIEGLNSNHPKLLLHACCAPCSTACLFRVLEYFDVTIYFYNPNIYPEAEYFRRRDGIFEFVRKVNESLLQKDSSAAKVKIVEREYNPSEYDNAVRINENPELATEPERGERCRRCYEFRLIKAHEYACSNGFDFFATTLTLSPYKDATKVNEIGRQIDEEIIGFEKIEKGTKAKYLYTDFKKKNGYLNSLNYSKEYNLYRQNYCGCKYSLENTRPN